MLKTAERLGQKADGASGEWRIIWAGLMALVSFFFIVLKMFTVYPYAGDEHIYIYQAQLVAEGYRPYVDFALAHPPLQTLFTALILKFFDYSLVLGRLLPIGWCLLGGILLGILIKREYGVVASIAGLLLYLLAYEPLRASSHYTGVNMTVTLLIAAVLAYRMERIGATAILCVLAVFTRLYAGPGVAALVVCALVAHRRDGLRLVAWGTGIGLLSLFALSLWTDFGQMRENLVLYHMQKTPMDEHALAGMKDKVLFHNFANVVIFFLGQFALVACLMRGYRSAAGEMRRSAGPLSRLVLAVQREKLGLVILADAIAWLMLAVLLRMERVWMYYFIPSFPFAALIGGWLAAKWTSGFGQIVRTRGRVLKVDKWRFAGGGLLLVLFVIGWASSPALEQRLGYYAREMKKPADERVHTYQWKSGYLPEFLNDFVRVALWRDERIIGETYHRFHYYLWHESRVLDIVDDVVSTIKKETSSQGEIFGDSGTVPLFALMSGRRIAANQVDTNIQRFRSGAVKPTDLIEAIDTEKLELIILRHRFGVAGLSAVQQLVGKKYRRIRVIRSAQGRVFLVFKRR